jgi:DNA-binding NtrC family response regulator
MASNSTLLCIHRDPAQLSLLRESGYELVTTANRHEGLRLLDSRLVDGIVLEHYQGIADSAAMTAAIKQARPGVPIVMLTDHLEVTAYDLEAVDALVLNADGPQFLLATLQFVLKKARTKAPAKPKPSRRTRLSPPDSFRLK